MLDNTTKIITKKETPLNIPNTIPKDENTLSIFPLTMKYKDSGRSLYTAKWNHPS